MKLKPLKQPLFIPTTPQELAKIGWQDYDILLVNGDAYYDHPSQGAALLGRWLIAHGFKVAIAAQPNWNDRNALNVFNRPKLFAAVSAGAMDSMLAHYTAFRKKRSTDAMSPGGLIGLRPNRATLVYSSLIKETFPGLPLIIGGVEASLRRLSHYDFWQNKLKRSILLDSKADCLVYGPGEKPLLAIAKSILNNQKISNIQGTVEASRIAPDDAIILPSHEELIEHKELLIKATSIAEQLIHDGQKTAFQAAGNNGIIINPPAFELTTSELDFVYGLPYTRKIHPSYTKQIPATEMLKNSITSHRGCGGGCSFCSIALLQGRKINSRSKESLINEAMLLSKQKKVALSDVGAGTANFWQANCDIGHKCSRKSCLWPKLCKNLKADQNNWLSMLEEIAALPNIKSLRVASGVRYDLFQDNWPLVKKFMDNFVGGQLKVAPEHLADDVLNLMRKPGFEEFNKFYTYFKKYSKNTKKYLIPYLMSCFPGSTQQGTKLLAKWFHEQGWNPQQTQAFIPTPGTMATAYFYAKQNEAGQPIFIANSDAERLKQHNLLYQSRTYKKQNKLSNPG